MNRTTSTSSVLAFSYCLEVMLCVTDTLRLYFSFGWCVFFILCYVILSHCSSEFWWTKEIFSREKLKMTEHNEKCYRVTIHLTMMLYFMSSRWHTQINVSHRCRHKGKSCTKNRALIRLKSINMCVRLWRNQTIQCDAHFPTHMTTTNTIHLFITMCMQIAQKTRQTHTATERRVREWE